MTSPIIYETFDQWFHEQEGYSLRSERAEGEIEWVKAAFEAGRAGALSQAVSAVEREDKYCPTSYYTDAIRKLGEDK